VESVLEGHGIEKSSVSRQFIAALSGLLPSIGASDGRARKRRKFHSRVHGEFLPA